MARRKKVYEGKAKILYEGPEPGTLIQYFKDDSAPTIAEATPAAVEAEAARAAAAEAVLVIRARAQTWVQVRNAAGQVVLQKELAAGDSYAAEGSPPWSVVIGRVDAADAIVRGQPMDLKAIARNNIARFEVK